MADLTKVVELHFAEVESPEEMACGVSFQEAGRVEFRRGAFLAGLDRGDRCRACVAVAMAWCPEVEA